MEEAGTALAALKPTVYVAAVPDRVGDGVTVRPDTDVPKVTPLVVSVDETLADDASVSVPWARGGRQVLRHDVTVMGPGLVGLRPSAVTVTLEPATIPSARLRVICWGSWR